MKERTEYQIWCDDNYVINDSYLNTFQKREQNEQKDIQ